MKFASIHLNYLFMIPVLLIGIYIFAHKRREVLLRKIAQEHLLAHLKLFFNKKKQDLKTAILIVAVFLSIVALLRPQWGFVWEEVKQQGIDVFIVMDVSKSMLTKDVLPSRLERAKLALEDLVKDLKGDRIGLIAFAGSSFVQCPLTIDYNGFLLAVGDLGIHSIPKAGTNIEIAIEQALRSFTAGSEGTNRALIIITDGESHEGNPMAAVEKAVEESVKIYTIGVGTTEGELISITDEQGKSSFLKDSEGRVIKSRLNETLLQEIALRSGGSYVKSTAREFGLEMLYNNKIALMEKREIQANMQKRFQERFQIPLALAILLFSLEPFIDNRKKR